MEAKGKGLLKVFGVLFIIEGIIGIICYGILTLILSAGTIIEHEGLAGATVTGVAAMYTISAIVSLIAGIVGVKYAAEPKGAIKCLVLGIINLVLTFIAGMWSVISGGVTVIHALYAGLGLIIPSLYIAGAYINAKQ